jgi:hypothetical protein
MASKTDYTTKAWKRSTKKRRHFCAFLNTLNQINFIPDIAFEPSGRVLRPDSSVGAAIDEVEKLRNRPIPTAEFNIRENGATCGSVLNTWRWNKGEQTRLEGGEDVVVDAGTMDPRAKRLDYMFVGSSGQSFGDSDRGKWVVEEATPGA